MPRRIQKDEIEVRPPRTRRLIFYVNEENEKRWKKLFVDMNVKNYEEALMRLLDIYEYLAKQFGTTKLDEIKRKLEEVLGVGVKLKIIEK
jgi:hypothetical protein